MVLIDDELGPIFQPTYVDIQVTYCVGIHTVLS